MNSVMRYFVQTCTAYEEIFGGTNPLIDNVDMILTSIGDIAGAEKDPLYLDMKESENVVTDAELHEVTSGNICGAWLPKDPSNEDHIAQIEGINNRWLGIEQKQLEACAMRSGLNGESPGVVVVAADPKQAKIIRQAVGMFNTLVISRELAEALLELGRDG